MNVDLGKLRAHRARADDRVIKAAKKLEEAKAELQAARRAAIAADQAVLQAELVNESKDSPPVSRD